MGTKQIDIALNSYLPDLLNGLGDEGISCLNYLNNPLLKKLDIYDPNSYIPNMLLEEILIKIKTDLGVNILSSDFCKYFKSTTMGKYSMHIFQSPNFLTLLNETIKYQKYLRSNYEVKLEILGAVSRFSVKIIEAPSHGKLVSEEIDIMRILDAFKLIGGPEFTPREIGITGKRVTDLECILPMGDYKIKVDQDESWVLFNSSMLSNKNPHLVTNVSLDNNVGAKNPISFKIEMMLDSFQTGCIPNLEEIATMFDVSRRTIERKLFNEGATFRQIKEKYLLRTSLELLQGSKLSVKEIAENLNFANSRNYIRSFKAWTGTSPGLFRENLI